LNNPFLYTDPTGEVFGIGFITGFFKGLFKGENPLKTAWRDGVNDLKITAGLFTGNPLQILSRFTWELPQTIAGFLYADQINIWGTVNSVEYWGGATVLNTNTLKNGAVTLGSYIVGNNSIKADPNNSLFQHEYGHYLQSQSMGWAYFSRIGIPSIMSANGDGNHKYQPFEQDANRRAFLYFNENVEGFYKSFEDKNLNRGWSFWQNPLDVYHTGPNSRGDYYDYHNSKDIALINSLSLHTKWYDYAGWIGGPLGAFGVGIYNGLYYNKNRIK